MRWARGTAFLLGFGLLAHGVARAQNGVTVRPILKAGDVAGDQTIPRKYTLFPNGLSDQGHLVMVAWDAVKPAGETLIQYADGKFTTIVAPGLDGPGGVWPKEFWTGIRASNLRGTTVFPAHALNGLWLGLFRWDAESGTLSQWLKRGMPVGSLGTAYGMYQTPRINNHDEMAIAMEVREPSGKHIEGVFFAGRDGSWQPVLLPGQDLPGGGTVLREEFFNFAVNDAGAVAFLARRQGEKQFSAYLWEKGQVTPLLAVGTDAPEGGKFTSISSAQPSSANRDVFLTAAVDDRKDHGIYRLTEGKVLPVITPRQPLSGGGTFKSILDLQNNAGPNSPMIAGGLGATNPRGQLAAMVYLTDGRPALYRIEPDGTLALMLRQGQKTDAGTVNGVGGPTTITSKGEIAVQLWLGGGPQGIAIVNLASPQ